MLMQSPVLSPTVITNTNTFDRKLTDLNAAVWDAINKHVEVSKPTPYSKRWWSTSLTQDKRHTTRLGRKAQTLHDYPDHPIHEEYRQQRNKYSQNIKKAKAAHWINWLEGLDGSSVWQASRFLSSPPTDAARTRIPTLLVKNPVSNTTTNQASSNKEKSALLYKTFFPATNPHLTPPPDDYQYPPPKMGVHEHYKRPNPQSHREVKTAQSYNEGYPS